METKDMTLADYIEQIGIKVTIKPCDMPESAPKWAQDHFHNAYRVAVRYEGRRMFFYFYAGKGVKDLKPADIIADLARNWDNCIYSLDEFGNEFGWNSETTETYRVVKSLGQRYADLIGNSEIRTELGEFAMEW